MSQSNTQVQFKGISAAAALDMANRYRNECVPVLSSSIPGEQNRPDARSLHIPLQSLRNFLQEVEAALTGITNSRDLGVRIYYAKYPDIQSIQQDVNHPLHKDYVQVPVEFSHHHTMFMVATCHQNEVDIDIDWERSKELRRVVPLAETQGTGARMVAMNHGNLCPPPFNQLDPTQKKQGLFF